MKFSWMVSRALHTSIRNRGTMSDLDFDFFVLAEATNDFFFSEIYCNLM